jgi:hypothetical protein
VGEFEQRMAADREEIQTLSTILPNTAPCPDKCEIMIGDITI